MKYLLLAGMIAAMSGCATVAKTNYAQMSSSLSLGMVRPQVISVLGHPKKNSMRSTDGKAVEELYYWSSTPVGYRSIDNEHLASDKVVVILVDGKVSEWGDPNSPDRIIERTTRMQAEMLKAVTTQQANQPQ